MNNQDNTTPAMKITTCFYFCSVKWFNDVFNMSCGESCQMYHTHTCTHDLQSVLFIRKKWLNESSFLREVPRKVRKGVIFSFSDWTDAPEDRLQISLEAFPSAHLFQIQMWEICHAGLKVPISMTTVVLLDLSVYRGPSLLRANWQRCQKSVAGATRLLRAYFDSLRWFKHTVKWHCLLPNSICSSIHPSIFGGPFILSSVIMFHCFFKRLMDKLSNLSPGSVRCFETSRGGDRCVCLCVCCDGGV